MNVNRLMLVVDATLHDHEKQRILALKRATMIERYGTAHVYNQVSRIRMTITPWYTQADGVRSRFIFAADQT